MRKAVVSPGAVVKANNDLLTLAKSIGRSVDGNKCATGASSGQFVVLLNSTISGRADGLYTASKAIPANTAIDSSYLTAVSDGGLNVLNSNLSKLNSDDNTTTDIIASALAATRTTFFKGSGTGYTGTVPAESALNYGSFIVNVRNTYRYIIGVNTEGKIYTNVYGGSAWYGWQELALNSKMILGTPFHHVYFFGNTSSLLNQRYYMNAEETSYYQIQFNGGTKKIIFTRHDTDGTDTDLITLVGT